MSGIIKKVVLSVTVLAAVLLPAASAFAENPFSQLCTDNNAKASTVCQSAGGDPITSKTGIVREVTLLIAIIAGVVAVIVLVIGGIRFIASNGDAEQVTQAKRTITYALIGLAVIALGQTIIMFILSRI